MTLKEDAKKIYLGAIKACLPDGAVEKALADMPDCKGKLILVAIGKAAWKMAKRASEILKDKIYTGVVITKYAHSEGEIDGLEIFEAGHPVPDENTVKATEYALKITENLSADDRVLFLISGGGSALFEKVEIELSELADITKQLLSCSASIEEINTVRKHLSEVKGGRFASHVAPAEIYAIILSDVLGNRLDTIASGPSVSDKSSVTDVEKIISKYNLRLSQKAKKLLLRETPKSITNEKHVVSGSVSELCYAAKTIAEELGYKAEIINDALNDEAKDVGDMLGRLAEENRYCDIKKAFIFGGETVVTVRGNGLGGRNQELALSAAKHISGIESVAVFSVGSDGTDGPTDAAGGYADKDSFGKLGDEYHSYLENNDAYHALQKTGGLIFTGPTGTNVNDLSVVLINPDICK